MLLLTDQVLDCATASSASVITPPGYLLCAACRTGSGRSPTAMVFLDDNQPAASIEKHVIREAVAELKFQPFCISCTAYPEPSGWGGDDLAVSDGLGLDGLLDQPDEAVADEVGGAAVEEAMGRAAKA